MTADYDMESAARFLAALDYKATSFVFQTFTDAKPKPQPDPLAHVIAGVSTNGPLTELHDRGAGIYVTINEIEGDRRRTEAVKRIRATWCEADGGLPAAWPIDPTLINETSPGRYHCFWLIAGDWPTDEAGKADFDAVMKCMIDEYGSDPGAKDLVRVLRVPGFSNRKHGEPFMVRGCGGSGHKYIREEIVKAFKPKASREEPPHTEGTPTGIARITSALEAIPADETALKAKFPDQGSHLVFVRIGQALHGWCSGDEAGFALWRDWCSRSPKFNEAGLRAQWRSFKADRAITIATLCYYAKAFGWRQDETEETKPNGADKPSALTAASLKTMTFPPLKWVVQGLLAEGLALLIGKPKLGKSWLCLDIATGVADSRFVLGDIQCHQGDVLYLALEDGPRRLQRRLRKLLGSNGHWPDRLTFWTECPRVDAGGLDRLREWLISHPEARLIVIDILGRFRPASKQGEQLYDRDYRAGEALQALATEHGVLIIVVHHARKAAADDPLDTVSSTTGLTAVADTVAVLHRDAGTTILDLRGRDVEEASLAVTFNKLTCRWTLQGTADDARRSDTRNAILAVLLEADEPMSDCHISQATCHKRATVAKLLHRMVADGEVNKIKRGRYVHPSRMDLQEAK